MYTKRKNTRGNSRIKRNLMMKGISLETSLQRMLQLEETEGLENGTALHFNTRAEGVRPEYNIRTDRFELALQAMDEVGKMYLAKREQKGQSVNENIAQKRQEKLEAKVNAANIALQTID